MSLQQVSLFLPTHSPSPDQLRSFWTLIKGDPDGLTDVNEIFYSSVQPFLAIGSFNSRSEAFMDYRHILAAKPPKLISIRYSTRAKDELMDWLQAFPVRPQIFSASYRYWARFPNAWISTYLYPVEVTLITEKLLSKHQAIVEWTAADRRGLQDLANEALALLECPPKLEEYRQLQKRRAA